MAVRTECQTHDAVYEIEIRRNRVTVTVELPFRLRLAKAQRKILRVNLHNAAELVLARYFQPPG
jgi:hypothetical protein